MPFSCFRIQGSYVRIVWMIKPLTKAQNWIEHRSDTHTMLNSKEDSWKPSKSTSSFCYYKWFLPQHLNSILLRSWKDCTIWLSNYFKLEKHFSKAVHAVQGLRQGDPSSASSYQVSCGKQSFSQKFSVAWALIIGRNKRHVAGRISHQMKVKGNVCIR